MDDTEDDLAVYFFGNSTILHVSETDETTVPFWLDAFADWSGEAFAFGGQFGFLQQHADLPPRPLWGFEGGEASYDPDAGETFADADHDAVVVTASNFIQFQPPTVPFEFENPEMLSPVELTVEIADWVAAEEPGIRVLLYENWPDMAPFLANGFPPTAEEFAAYNAYTLGEFHAWWEDYAAGVQAARPEADIALVPVGSVLAGLFTETRLSEIPPADLYSDDAPHGTPTLYFLASVVTHMALDGAPPPADFPIPASVDPLVAELYPEIVAYTAAALGMPTLGAGLAEDEAQTVALLYEAALDRDGNIDLEGLNFWIDAREGALPSGAAPISEATLAEAFLSAPEFVDAFGDPAALSDTEFVDILYFNILDREAEPDGREFWIEALGRPAVSQADVLLAFAKSPENREGSAFVEDLAEVSPGEWAFV